MNERWRTYKSKYPNSILLFRSGDYYTCYNEDAEEAARICCVTLHDPNKAGFPAYSIETVLDKLFAAEKHVVYCGNIDKLLNN